MAWECTYRQDTAADGLGTITATFTDDKGVVWPSYERQVKTLSSEDCSAFANEARAWLAERQAIASKYKGISDAAVASVMKELNQ